MLNVELVFGLVFVGCLWLFSLWENPPQWRTPRQTEGGIFHRHRHFCFCVYRAAARMNKWIRTHDLPYFLWEFPYAFLPLRLCQIGFEVWRVEHSADFEADIGSRS